MNANNLKTLGRARALDALRGLAILAMIFSGTIPFDNTLPSWMYHAQVPPPHFRFNPNLPGITWVDLVFPCFLFALGAAIPFALTRRIERGQSQLKIIMEICKRSFLLFSFAIITEHFRPLVINPDPGDYTWKLALFGYFLLFLMYVQLPKYIPKKIQHLVTFLGWTLGIIFLSKLKYLQDTKHHGFSLYRSDIILLVLANIVLSASLIWLFTRKNIVIRFCLLLPLFPLIYSFNNFGWNTQFLWKLPLMNGPMFLGIFDFDFLKYLFIALPGTVVGDWLLSWLQQENDYIANKWKRSQLWLSIIILFCLIFSIVSGLYSRNFTLMSIGIIVFAISAYFLFKHPASSTEILINRLYGWAIYSLIVGLCFEPYEGGIKKDSATFSYYFVTTAIAIFLLIIFMIIIDLLKSGSYLSIFIDNGQNPMLAYVSFGNFLWPIIALSPLKDLISQWTQGNPALGILKGLIYTLIIAIWTSLFTRFKFFWKT